MLRWSEVLGDRERSWWSRIRQCHLSIGAVGRGVEGLASSLKEWMGV